MAFDLLDRRAIYIPVKWPGLTIGDGGEAVPIEHEVEIQVEILDNDAMQAWIAAGKSLDGNEGEIDPDRTAKNVAYVRTVAQGWRKVVGNGRPLPFNDENIGRMLNVPGFNVAFATAYLNAWLGTVATRTGNSEGSPANGQTGEPTAETPAAKTSSSKGSAN